ncbi:uncharacterized protein LOC131929394 isoform X2 [Physella acuta]|uniref:uncharacterized protein LOC131929394 isoform X2 n=1 Tax=Physella acuta TaxID=109671 RepID=UPI0027DC3B8B|nr:uncharacterized protein LOC131929394 isoform X2 [Physella acuta]
MSQQPYPSAGTYPPPGGPPPPYSDSSQNPMQPDPATPQASAASSNTHVTHDKVNTKQEQPKEKKGGFFSNLKKEAEKVGKQLGHELDKAGKTINDAVDRNYQSALLDLFKNGNVVQLVSRVTGRTLQIVISSTGQMVLDANGPLDPNAFNTLWTVTNEGSNQVRLHNYQNYITVIDGETVIRTYPPGTATGPETKFQLSQIHQQFVMLESLKEKNRHVGFMPSGELKPALATIKEPSSQLGVKLVSTPYPVITPVATSKPK